MAGGPGLSARAPHELRELLVLRPEEGRHVSERARDRDLIRGRGIREGLGGQVVDVLIVSSMPDGGVDPAVFFTAICGLSPETAAPVQSVTLIFTGIVLPYLKMLGSWCAWVSFTGCSTPLAVYRWDTALVLELLVPKPLSLSVTLTVTV